MTAVSLNRTASPLLYSPEDSFCRIGLIVLATDLTSEHDFIKICNNGRIRLHISRTEYKNPVTPENLRAMKDGLAEAAALLVPDIPLQAVYFSCTSGGALLGDKTVAEKIQSAVGRVPVITPLSAATSAFTALGTRKLSILTPYTENVARPVGSYFENSGFTVQNISYMGLVDDREMARIKAESIIAAAKETISGDAEALFISCTALRSAEVAGLIEKKIGKPVVTSNQAAAWKALKIACIVPDASGYGKLLSSKMQ
ncbi:aspartate/glutamate racemase family protein [Desulfopila sp. IMCC35008]|uniref:aspartate racemase/maleate isomerase family protein n=1 Tax=Desulfopila sp. IMCC35008 TaxID=2653858 RepID=UPI0013D8BD93|nr:aspartate/glutamate racemase family protein [Desulfopila sp. IMCC35008]